MILLLGGTAETASLATAIAEAGYTVLVSTATDAALDIGNHPRIRRRTGILDDAGLRALIVESSVRAVVDATHPYASAVSRTARDAAKACRIPCFVFVRPPAIAGGDNCHFVESHEDAARLAFSLGRSVFLTTGSRNLSPYAAAAKATGGKLTVRVLDEPESLRACREAGIAPENIIIGRGPFSHEENLSIIRTFGIDVMVTKDGGTAGGAEAKVDAARESGCALIVISRPPAPGGSIYRTLPDLIPALRAAVPSL